jgi:hypothetical protein
VSRETSSVDVLDRLDAWEYKALWVLFEGELPDLNAESPNQEFISWSVYWVLGRQLIVYRDNQLVEVYWDDGMFIFQSDELTASLTAGPDNSLVLTSGNYRLLLEPAADELDGGVGYGYVLQGRVCRCDNGAIAGCVGWMCDNPAQKCPDDEWGECYWYDEETPPPSEGRCGCDPIPTSGLLLTYLLGLRLVRSRRR